MSLSNFTAWLDAQVAALRASKHFDKIKKFFAYFGLFMALGSVGVMLKSAFPLVGWVVLIALAITFLYLYVRTKNDHVILLTWCFYMLSASSFLVVFCFATAFALHCVFILDTKQARMQTA